MYCNKNSACSFITTFRPTRFLPTKNEPNYDSKKEIPVITICEPFILNVKGEGINGEAKLHNFTFQFGYLPFEIILISLYVPAPFLDPVLYCCQE